MKGESTKTRALPPDSPVKLPLRQLTKEEFGRRLEKLMLDKGWNQSELARQATRHAEKPIGRDSISIYVRGRSFPGPLHLHPIASALGVTPADLLPNTLASAADAATPALELRQVPGHPETFWLKVNQAVPYAKALEIVRILEPSSPASSSGERGAAAAREAD
jgi:transcriptional regulator with XRE-family HTH domain